MNEYQQLIIDALIDKKCEALMNCISKRNTLKSTPTDQISRHFIDEFIAFNAKVDAAIDWIKTRTHGELL